MCSRRSGSKIICQRRDEIIRGADYGGGEALDEEERLEQRLVAGVMQSPRVGILPHPSCRFRHLVRLVAAERKAILGGARGLLVAHPGESASMDDGVA